MASEVATATAGASGALAEAAAVESESEQEQEPVSEGSPKPVLSVAQRARIERNRLRARALQDARLVKRPPEAGSENGPVAVSLAQKGGARALDSGGGFLIEEEPAPPPPRAARDAPVVDPAEQPRCVECGTQFPQSYLFDTFGFSCCDACRDAEGEHALLTRTEAKAEFLLQDCDLDARPPPLRCVRRRNPHRLARADMRLYLRAQVQARALEVWGSRERLQAERERRAEARGRTKHKQTQRRLRALRMDVRSSLYERGTKAHAHRFGPERHVDDDQYERECLDCGHKETYEKM